MEEQVRVNAVIDLERKRRLFHVLLDEGITFTEWLRRQIDQYLQEKEPKEKRPNAKEGAK